jgi:hypothetical protein
LQRRQQVARQGDARGEGEALAEGQPRSTKPDTRLGLPTMLVAWLCNRNGK